MNIKFSNKHIDQLEAINNNRDYACFMQGWTTYGDLFA